MMKKKGMIMALALSMVLGSVPTVYGADFTNGPQETASTASAESIFSGAEDENPYETPVPDVNVQNAAAEELPSVNETDTEPEAELPEEENQDIFLTDVPEEENDDAAEPEEPVMEENEDGDAEIFAAAEEEKSEILSMADFQYTITDSKITIVAFVGGQIL